MELGGVWRKNEARGGGMVQPSQQDILFELPNTISSNKKGETFEIISHRRDTETLIVTLAQGQGWGGRLPSRRASGRQSKSTSRKSLKLKVDEKSLLPPSSHLLALCKGMLLRHKNAFCTLELFAQKQRVAFRATWWRSWLIQYLMLFNWSVQLFPNFRLYVWKLLSKDLKIP